MMPLVMIEWVMQHESSRLPAMTRWKRGTRSGGWKTTVSPRFSGAGIAGLVATWLATVGCVFLAFYLQYFAHRDIDHMEEYRKALQGVALAVGLLCPLFRIALAPMALAWNRHR